MAFGVLFFRKPKGPKRGSLETLKFINQTKLGHKAHDIK